MYDLYANYQYALTGRQLRAKIEKLLLAGQNPAGFVNVIPPGGYYGMYVFLVNDDGRYRYYGPSPEVVK